MQFDDEPGDVYYFSYSYPYTYTDLQRYLYGLDRLSRPFYRRELLCRTPFLRRMDLITITDFDVNPNAFHEDCTSDARAHAPADLFDNIDGARPEPGRIEKNVVIISARIHPGESPASYIMHGLISFLTSNAPEAALLRKHLVFKLIPMLNPDGVAMGNYRSNGFGYDLNRHWNTPHPATQREVHATKDLVVRHASSLAFYIDLHSHSTATNSFMYCNSRETPTVAAPAPPAKRTALRPALNDGAQHADPHSQQPHEQEEQEKAHSSSDSTRFPFLFAARSKEFSFEQSRFDSDPCKEGTGRRALGDLLGADTHCYTLEVSFFAASMKAPPPPPPTPGGFMAFGAPSSGSGGSGAEGGSGTKAATAPATTLRPFTVDMYVFVRVGPGGQDCSWECHWLHLGTNATLCCASPWLYL